MKSRKLSKTSRKCIRGRRKSDRKCKHKPGPKRKPKTKKSGRTGKKPIKQSRKCIRGRRKSDGKCKRKSGPKRKPKTKKSHKNRRYKFNNKRKFSFRDRITVDNSELIQWFIPPQNLVKLIDRDLSKKDKDCIINSFQTIGLIDRSTGDFLRQHKIGLKPLEIAELLEKEINDKFYTHNQLIPINIQPGRPDKIKLAFLDVTKLIGIKLYDDLYKTLNDGNGTMVALYFDDGGGHMTTILKLNNALWIIDPQLTNNNPSAQWGFKLCRCIQGCITTNGCNTIEDIYYGRKISSIGLLFGNNGNPDLKLVYNKVSVDMKRIQMEFAKNIALASSYDPSSSILATTICNLPQLCSKWDKALHKGDKMGCAINTVSFLEIFTRETASVDLIGTVDKTVGTSLIETVRLLYIGKIYQDTLEYYKKGLRLDTAFEKAIEDTNSFIWSEKEFKIRDDSNPSVVSEKLIREFYDDYIDKNLSANQCTILRMNRGPTTIGYTVVIGKTRDGFIHTIDPQNVSEKIWDPTKKDISGFLKALNYQNYVSFEVPVLYKRYDGYMDAEI